MIYYCLIVATGDNQVSAQLPLFLSEFYEKIVLHIGLGIVLGIVYGIRKIAINTPLRPKII